MASKGDLRVTVLYSKSCKRIIFLEAGKDFVDLLMSFLLLPVGSVIKLLRDVDTNPVGGISNVVVKMQGSSFSVEKGVLTDPKPSSAFGVLQIEGSEHSIYTCQGCCSYYSVGWPMPCPCGDDINRGLVEVTPQESSSNDGYVVKNIVFTFTDDLEIYPSSTVRSIVNLTKFKVKDMGDLDSVEIAVSTDDVLRLLKSSLTSKTVLNDVFGPRLVAATR